MESHLFEGLDGRPRSSKPRSTGLTMVVDWGIGPAQQQDLQVTAADHFDFAKIAVGLSRLYTNEILTRKINSYRALDIEPFPGGQYLEYAQMQGKLDHYLPACFEAGYRWIEVSDNVAPVGLEWKVRVIQDAVQNYGMEVFGEIGKKEGLDHSTSFADDAKACLDAGAKIILVEAAELVNADPETEREVEETVEAVGVEQIMFELPGPWIEGVDDALIHKLRRGLVDRFGVEVNVGNVMPDDLYSFEAYRRELGVNAGSEPAD
ncbi:MAG TPA: hypothetical protein DHW45_14530 [Candidatus Latescibacteria bacterium]|jgi:phosphosulfolactate synthase|nr:hypothetical protein [Candidatus Latescibacterota bacterium]